MILSELVDIWHQSRVKELVNVLTTKVSEERTEYFKSYSGINCLCGSYELNAISISSCLLTEIAEIKSSTYLYKKGELKPKFGMVVWRRSSMMY